jgi:hypothetical protein
MLKGILVLVATLALAATAQAVPVTYTTQASFDGINFFEAVSHTYGSGDDTATLTYTNASGKDVEADSSSLVSLGRLTATATGDGAVIGDHFYIRVLQTASAEGSGTFTSILLQGRIKPGRSDGAITFSPNTIKLPGNVIYVIENGGSEMRLTAPNSETEEGMGVTLLMGRLSDLEAAVPEPATYALIGSGLVSLSMFVRRRKRV